MIKLSLLVVLAEVEYFFDLVGVVCWMICGAEASECRRIEVFEEKDEFGCIFGRGSRSTCRADELNRLDFRSVRDKDEDRFTDDVVTCFVGIVMGFTRRH